MTKLRNPNHPKKGSSTKSEPIRDPKVHLACFSTDPNNDRNMKEQVVTVVNRFGKQQAKLRRVATTLCVTSEKFH